MNYPAVTQVVGMPGPSATVSDRPIVMVPGRSNTPDAGRGGKEATGNAGMVNGKQ